MAKYKPTPQNTDTDVEPTADVPETDVIDQAPEEVQDEDRARLRDLDSNDRNNIVKEFNASGANVAEIADKYDVSPAEVFAIVDEYNEGR